MIDLQLFLDLVESSDTHSLSGIDTVGCFDKCQIDSGGIRVRPINNQTFQCMAKQDQEAFNKFSRNISLVFPCSLNEFHAWILRNGFNDLFNIPLDNYLKKLKNIAEMKAQRAPKKIYVEDLFEQNIPNWDGAFASLVQLYRCKYSLENDRHKTEKDRYKNNNSDIAKYEERVSKLNLKLHEVNNAINGQHVPSESAHKPKNGRREKQFQIIEAITVDLGFDIMNIPYGGKRKIQTKCLEDFRHLFTQDGFLSAWKDFSKERKLSIANRESFSKRTY